MANCGSATAVVSSLPDYARNAHGNLAEQSRNVGPSRGDETLVSVANAVPTVQVSQNLTPNTALASVLPTLVAPEKIVTAGNSVPLASIKSVLDKNACLACHGMNNKLVGPSFKDIAARYKTTDVSVALLSGKIRDGSQGAWGAIPMPAQALSAAESAQIAQWLIGGMPP